MKRQERRRLERSMENAVFRGIMEDIGSKYREVCGADPDAYRLAEVIDLELKNIPLLSEGMNSRWTGNCGCIVDFSRSGYKAKFCRAANCVLKQVL